MKNMPTLLLITSYLRLHVKSTPNNKHISIYRFSDLTSLQSSNSDISSLIELSLSMVPLSNNIMALLFVSYPNFVRGRLFVNIWILIDRIELLNTNCRASRRVLQRFRRKWAKYSKWGQNGQFRVLQHFRRKWAKYSKWEKILFNLRLSFLVMEAWGANTFPMCKWCNPTPLRVLDRRLQEAWARATKEGPRVLMNLRVDFWAHGSRLDSLFFVNIRIGFFLLLGLVFWSF